MKHDFENSSRVTIDPGPPALVTSEIDVGGIDGGTVEDVDVEVDIDHSWVGDLSISLLNPSGQRVVLADRRGGQQDHFRATVFDADAPTSILNAVPPFTGAFRPQGDLADFRNRPANGRWTLEVNDRASQDGGALKRWRLSIATSDPAPSDFRIDVRFMGGLTIAQQDAFAAAAARWSEIIIGDVPDIRVAGSVVDDVLIEAEGIAIDGRGSILGQAGPTRLRPGSFLPASGVMSFDSADLAQMEADGSLVRVIIHEMGHVLGLGTIWDELGLRQGAGTTNPTFTGAAAMREFATLRGQNALEAVPVANVGGPGTRDSHWRELVFGNELMTGLLNAGANPLSRLTAAALQDMGYEVQIDAADDYALPSALEIAMMGVGGDSIDPHDRGIMLRPTPGVLPTDALV